MRHSLYIIILCLCCEISAQTLYLELVGKDSVETAAIEKLGYKTTFGDFASLQGEADSLKSRLQRRGWLESELLELRKKTDTLYQGRFALGRRYEHIRVKYKAGSVDRSWLMELASPQARVTDSSFVIAVDRVGELMAHLSTRAGNSGHPFARFRLVNIRPNDEENIPLQADMEVTEDRQRTIDSIAIRGYDNFPVAFIRYELGIRRGRVFNRDEILEKSRLLENLGFVRNIKPPEVLFTDEETVVYFFLERANSNLFDGIIGFATDEESGKLEFNGYLNLILSNNLNRGEKLTIDYKNDGQLQEQFQAQLAFPYLFRSPVGVEAGLSLFKRDTTFLTLENHVHAVYRLSTTSRVFAGYKAYKSDHLQDELLPGTGLLEDYTARFGVFGFGYSRLQDNRLFPVKTTGVISNELGRRNDQTGATGRYRGTLKAHHIFNLNPRNFVYLANQTSYIGGENIYTNELFRFGGINSIRGFDENSIDASLFSVLNAEYRFLLSPGSFIHSITDVAWFENRVNDLSTPLYGFGLGIGLQTRAGLLRLNIANGVQEGQDFSFSNTKVHVSLHAMF